MSDSVLCYTTTRIWGLSLKNIWSSAHIGWGFVNQPNTTHCVWVMGWVCGRSCNFANTFPRMPKFNAFVYALMPGTSRSHTHLHTTELYSDRNTCLGIAKNSNSIHRVRSISHSSTKVKTANIVQLSCFCGERARRTNCCVVHLLSKPPSPLTTTRFIGFGVGGSIS